jgi:hypothetical protein
MRSWYYLHKEKQINMPTKIRTCSDNHDQIMYESDTCPVCRQRLLMDEVLDDQENIDQENIYELYRELKTLGKRIKKLENVVFPTTKKTVWRWHPMRHAQSVPKSWAIPPADF